MHQFNNLTFYLQFSSVQFSSVGQSCPTLCDPMNRSTPSLPVHHQLPEFTQTHVHRVGDAIQLSHPLSSPSPTVPSPFQNQGLFQWVYLNEEQIKPMCVLCRCSHVWLCDPMDCSPPGSSVHEVLQARILEWVAMPCSRGSSWLRHQPASLMPPALTGSSRATWEAQIKPKGSKL